MSVISFHCSNGVEDKLTGLLKQLQEVGEQGKRRVIRIGGDEKVFDGTVDSISDIVVDGVSYDTPYVASIPARKQKIDSSVSCASVPSSTPSSWANIPADTSSDSDSDSDDGDETDDVDDGLTDAEHTTITLAVEDKVRNREMFTAFDITKEVRAMGIKRSHRSVKTIVHQIFFDSNMIDYNRQLVDLDGIRVAPWLYYPEGSDTTLYEAELQNAVGGQSSDGSYSY